MINIICIAGPTASGKTALAVEIAKAYNGEVVSCDSMQIYRRMDIGTAKPTQAEMQGIPHHMIDVAEPDEGFLHVVQQPVQPPVKFLHRSAYLVQSRILIR